jgi:hypothetical protein
MNEGTGAKEVYYWPYETILEEIPGLKDYDESDARLRKINKQMSTSIKTLLVGLKNEISIMFGKKKIFFDLKQEELERISLDKLVEYYEIIGKSVLDMVKKGKLNKTQILNVRSS